MAKIEPQNTASASPVKPPYWKRLMSLPPEMLLKDISTGEIHQRINLRTVYKDSQPFAVEELEDVNTHKRVHAKFLRPLGPDGNMVTV